MKKFISILLSAILAVSALGITASARLLGDVDGSKNTNSLDALKILMYSVGKIDTIDEKAADVNCDGKVNSLDALTVLRVSVDLYDGPTAIDLKPEVIDPIIKTGKFTLSTIVDTVDENGKPMRVPTTIMVDGKNVCVAMTVQISGKNMNARLLLLNGKAYMVLPDLKVYLEMSEEDVGSFDFGDISIGSDQTYAGSAFATENGKKYTVDSYKSSDGATSSYYFLDGKWAKLVTQNGDTTETQEIVDFKAGVNSSYFSLKGMLAIDPSLLK
ncbi:MAG TPA: hypothetical protein DCY15_08150 [Ruminococcaceae bacterium]|nr:hypothetical protein [Oscillospiraceae bacterium]